jgi:hypothetical protein
MTKENQTVKLIESLKSQAQANQLKIDYYIDEEKTFIKSGDISRLLDRPPRGQALILVPGPDGFANYLASRKIVVNGS